MKLRAVVTFSVLAFTLLLFSCDLAPDEYFDELVVPRYGFDLWGNSMRFYSDGYGLLSWVEYTFVNSTDVLGNNSENVQHTNMTWEFESLERNICRVRINYDHGGYETYTLHNKPAPPGYTGEYYYEYYGITGTGYSVSYDGSWNYPDLSLGDTHALIAFFVEDSSWDVVTFYLNGQQRCRVTSFRGSYVEKVSIGSKYTALVMYATSDHSQSHEYAFEFEIDAFGWFFISKSSAVQYRAGTMVE